MTVEEFAAALQAEYGKYRAKVPIFHDGAPAYQPGHPVPVSNVEAHGYLERGLVEEVPQPKKSTPEKKV